ncbi:MAG: efflux RND transporter periplasmic adaptor subunit, partial [Deltaproteobacteria bacterium]
GGDPEHAAAASRPDDPGTRVGDPADWCGGHGLPESMCTKCNPEFVARFEAAGDWCAEHGFPESACPTCHPMAPPASHAPPPVIAPGTVVRFATPAIERAAGIETVPATTSALGASVEATARVDFDRNALAEVRSAVPGIVREVAVDLGQRVAPGDRLFVLESARVGDLQARRGAVVERVAAARADLARQRELREAAIASQRQVDLAEQELEAARAELRSLDQSLRISGAAAGRAGRLEVTAPIAGTVVRRPGVLGAFAGESEPLATIADTARMWVILDVPEWDAANVHVGQAVDVRVDGVLGRRFAGRLTWIASEVDARTRTVAARAELDNGDGILRAGQFARATIRVGAPEGATAVPLSAVQRLEDVSVVFVRVAPGAYEPRVVRVGRSDGRHAQVEGALQPGDAVVTTGAYLLRTELSRDSIGAGCCEADGPKGE